jgi:hypothetical protein
LLLAKYGLQRSQGRAVPASSIARIEKIEELIFRFEHLLRFEQGGHPALLFPPFSDRSTYRGQIG